jgi:hypothetical protein
LLLWKFIREGRDVVYHCGELERTIVINQVHDDNNNNVLQIHEVPELKALFLPSLENHNTIFIFDADATKCYEPPIVRAFLIETSIRNVRNYAQTMRSGVASYCIPSYTVKELLSVCHHFGVKRQEVLRRCRLLGPSLRYILVFVDFDRSKRDLEGEISRMDPAYIGEYIRNSFTTSLDYGMRAIITPSLLKVEIDDTTEPSAYKEHNVQWVIASKKVSVLLLRKIQDESVVAIFVKQFIKTNNNASYRPLQRICDNYLAVVIGKFVAAGGYRYRKLQKQEATTTVLNGRSSSKKRKSAAITQEALIEPVRRPYWDIQSNIDVHDIDGALQSCNALNVLYDLAITCSVKIDYVANKFHDVFQVVSSESTAIHLDTIVAICDHVRNQRRGNKIVKLYFVVPEEMFGHYQHWQSFKFQESGHTTLHSIVSNLSAELQDKLSNLEQYVIYYN